MIQMFWKQNGCDITAWINIVNFSTRTFNEKLFANCKVELEYQPDIYLQNSVLFWLLSNKLTMAEDSPWAKLTEQPTIASTPQSECNKEMQ